MKKRLFTYFKRIVAAIFIAVVLTICFRGPVYRLLVRYQPVGQRALVPLENSLVQADLDVWVRNHPTAGAEEIVEYAVKYATVHISYTFGKCSTNPNSLLGENSKTNCIGYSACFHATVSYLIRRFKMEARLKSEQKVAHLFFFGKNVHSLFHDPAFKDHDYNVVTDLEKHKKYVIDPTLRAVFGISSVVEK